MGVPGYWSILKAYFPKAFASTGRTSYDHVLVDVNNLLHSAAAQATTEKEFWSRLFAFLGGTIRRTHPKKSVYLAVDGPAPFAKLMLQRERRAAIARKMQRTSGPQGFDTLQFTPGCMFMNKLDARLLSYGQQVVLRAGERRGVRLNLTLSGSRTPAEGEVKIYHHLANRLLKDPANSRDSFAIMGDDADLAIQALASDVPDLKILFPLSNQTFCPSMLNSSLVELLPLADPARTRMDLAFISLMGGNDYLPKLRGVSLVKVFKNYMRLRESSHKYLIDLNGRLNLVVLKELLGTRDSMGGAAHAQSPPAPNASLEATLSQVPPYLQGLLWNLRMYTTSVCPDYHFLYPFTSAPTTTSIRRWLHSATHLSPMEYTPPPMDVTSSSPLRPPLCSVAVLPLSRRDLVAEEYWGAMESFDKRCNGVDLKECGKALEKLSAVEIPGEIEFECDRTVEHWGNRYATPFNINLTRGMDNERSLTSELEHLSLSELLGKLEPPVTPEQAMRNLRGNVPSALARSKI
ncbi:hypothetical protein BC832DRAFT_590095 [Gaertneriomyces semiglobifer]|nr:hypothetical protein BC832DRAFT_590095 [Gaertneriomyces semiglobifer]